MITLTYLVGEDRCGIVTWYCRDDKTNKFYRKVIVSDDKDTMESIEEITESEFIQYAMEHLPKDIFKDK